MKTIYLILFLFISQLTFSQMWFSNDAQWKYRYYNFDTRVGYTQINVVGEEIKGGILCKKLHAVRYLQDITQFPPVTWLEELADYYVYEENNGDQVYYYANNQFYKLYDFAAQINDTWEVYNANFEITCIPNTGMVKVIATGTENIDGEDLKYIELNYVSGGADLSGKVYQKIGAIDRFFMPDYAAYTPECGYLPEDALLSNELLCFEDTNFLFNNGENACYEIILSNDDYEYSDSRLKIYKSNQKVVFLNNKTVLEFKVIIFDSDGKKVLSKTKKNTNKIEVNLNLTGVYFSIVELDGITYNKKIILRD